ncbi:MAG: hypothetical protein KF779_16960 [Hyphomonadaceae bacterium]|nr:hypothetical protein [Hyphomonadaceae bacterium]
MTRKATWVLPLAILFCTGCTTSLADRIEPFFGEPIEALVAADEAVALGSRTRGLDTVIAAFDDDVVVFAPPVPGFAHGPDNARATLTAALQGTPTALDWRPMRVGVSSDGQQGFSYGYIDYVSGHSAVIGKYVAYWIHRSDGWRILLFKLVPRPEGPITQSPLPHYAPPHRPVSTDAELIARYRQSLASQEQNFSDAAQTIGLSEAFVRFGRDDSVNVGGDSEFVVGAQNIGAIHPEGPSPLRWSADQGVIVATTGDLGATWGYLRRNGPTPPGRLAEIPFFTIWARDTPTEEWRYIAE